MFFNGILQRRLASLLRPWLIEEPQLETKLGFLRSHGIANNLRFNVSVINQLIDDPTCMSIKEITVEQLCIRISCWSFPAFMIEFRGVDITLSSGEDVEECSIRIPKFTDTSAEDLKKAICGLDPEGSALHDVLERISATTPRNQLSTSVLNLIFQHCRFQIRGIHLQVQFPCSDDYFMCFSQASELDAESQCSKNGSIIPGLISACILPLRESSFALNCKGFKIGLKKKDYVNVVVSSSLMSASVILKNLQLVHCNLLVPKSYFSFSPIDIALLFTANKILSKQFKRARNGKQLWKLARSKILFLISTPILLLQKVVDITISWLRYVNTYEQLLLLVGFFAKMPRDKKLSSFAKHQLALISKFENELPVEAIVSARRVARYRAGLNEKNTEDSYNVLLGHRCSNFFQKILKFLGLFWKIVYCIIHPFAHLFTLKKQVHDESSGSGRRLTISYKESCLSCFELDMGNVSITILPSNAIQPSVNEGDDLRTFISLNYLLSYCLSINGLFVRYTEDFSAEHTLSLSCGDLKVISAPFKEIRSKYLNSSKDRRKGRSESNDSQTILWSEPVQIFSFPEHTENARVSIIKNILRETWSRWKQSRRMFEEIEIQYSENPCIIFETKSSITDITDSYQCLGSWKCGFSTGKLNLATEYSSIKSIFLIYTQLQRALCEKNEILNLHLRSPRRVEDSYRCDEYFKKMKISLLGVVPDKNIEIGILIAGLSFQMPLTKGEFPLGKEGVDNVISQDDIQFVFDLYKIEAAICPRSNSDLWDNMKGECHKFEEEPRISEIPMSGNENYTSKGHTSFISYVKVYGVSAYLEVLSNKCQFQMLEAKPITFQLLCFKEYIHSMSSTVVACSANFYLMATGFTTLLCMDELSLLLKVVAALQSALAYTSDKFCSHDFVHCGELRNRDTALSEPENQITPKTTSNSNITLLVLNGTFDLQSMDLIIHNSRKCAEIDVYLQPIKMLVEYDLPDSGIQISVQQICIDISSDELKTEALINLTEIKYIIFRYPWKIGNKADVSELNNKLLQSLDSLCEMSFANCLFSIWLDCSTPGCETCCIEENNNNSPFSIAIEKPSVQPFKLGQKLGSISSSPGYAPVTDYWLLAKMTVSEIFITRCSVKNVFLGAHQTCKLHSSLSVGGELQRISCEIEGAFIFLETKTLAMLIRSSSAYLDCVKTLLSTSSEKSHESTILPHDSSIEENVLEMLDTPQREKLDLLEAFTMDLSRFSLILMIEDEADEVQELVLEAEIRLSVEVTNMKRAILFNLSRLSIISQVLHTGLKIEIQSRHFLPSIGDASCSNNPVNRKESSSLSYRSYILKHLEALVSVEKSSVLEDDNNSMHPVWVGTGSLSGFDIIISLHELQMILSMEALFSGISKSESIRDMKKRQEYIYKESDYNFGGAVPDGAIVAIQDVDQHMHISIERSESGCGLVGAIHYSLVGERALFMVKYHKQRKWKLPRLWFSLLSLNAKSDSGEPLTLCYRPGSGFVGLSPNNESNCSLWTTLSYKPENFDGDLDAECFNQLGKNTFYLVNKKNDCAVAFVDGALEFVRKPGNLFKFKVFRDLNNEPINEERSQNNGIIPSIDVRLSKITLTIVHELPDTRDKFPLFKGCIDNVQLNVQVLSSKFRVLSTMMIILTYFDAQRNLWRDFVPPANICIFYRSKFQIQTSEMVSNGVPMHFYLRLEKFNISLTELSLDILLFMIGELNLAGPFSVKSSMIIANCCKVENQSGLNLLCHFNNDQDVTIPKNQSSYIHLRRINLADQSSAKEASVSIQLAMLGIFSTSPIYVSFLEARVLAWRTRIVSLEDSKSYPGPFVVVDISRETEDGLSIIVSPLIKIHNETEFPMELRFQRPQQTEAEYASLVVKSGETIDDSVAVFDALSSSDSLKKSLKSLSVGNFLFCFKPRMITDASTTTKKPCSVEWSDDLKGGKAVRLAGLFEKLSYKVKKAFSAKSLKYSFSTARCSVKYENDMVSDMHFLIQRTGRDVPVIQPDKLGEEVDDKSVALQEQKEIFLLPTVRVSNLLQSEIHVLLTETDLRAASDLENIGNHANISCGSTVNFYVDPSIIYFNVTLNALNSSCKPVKSSDWVKKLRKQKNDVHSLDIDLEFCGGKYHASLRLFRGHRGILEAAIFTPYTVKNETDFSFHFYPPNQKPLSRDEAQKFGFIIPPELGLVLPSKSTGSWFLKSNKVCLKLLEDKASEKQLQFDALSGFTEISLETEDTSGSKYITKVGLSMGPSLNKVVVPSQTITMVPRHLVFNESKDVIIVRQCYIQNDLEGIVIRSGQKTTLQLRNGPSQTRQISIFDNFIRKHRSPDEGSLTYIQFQLSGREELGWSGPVCIDSLGRFFVKFRRYSDTSLQSNLVRTEFAAVHVEQEGSIVVLRFNKPPNSNLPYRIMNSLQEYITYYQKDSSEPDILGSESSVDYVWDDTTLPHKLVVQISDMHFVREINLDKVRKWKPFFKTRQQRGLTFPSPLDKKSKDKRINNNAGNTEMVKVGYEVYADGPTRVLRICESPGSQRGETLFQSNSKIRLRITSFAIHFLEHGKEGVEANEPSDNTQIIVARLENISLDSLITDQQNYNQLSVQSLNVDQKWFGAPFAAMLRGHPSNYSDTDDCMLHVVFVLLSSSSNVKQVKYSSVLLRPVDLNLDEETLMRLVPFFRTSLSTSTTPSQQFYFDHFEIHPIKIIASFLPGDSISSYSSSQETLRSLLHSVIKVPTIKNMVIELNGVLVTHALITMRELCIKCAQHYSWYAMRAIYIVKGSSLLPPAFASLFDDMSSSSLDVFFDPSSGLTSLPGLTLGTFKLISKCIDAKGFSGSKRYFGDLGKTLRTAGSNVLFAAVTEISDSVLKGAEASGVNGMVIGFHQGILKLAMEPSLLGTMFMEGGPDRKIQLDRSPGIDELYIEGYLQAMLDTMYKQEYLRVRVIDDQVFVKNLPPSSSLIDEIMDRIKGFLESKALLKGDSSSSRPLRHLRGETEWKIGPTVLTLCEHLFVSFAIRMLRKQSGMLISRIKWNEKTEPNEHQAITTDNISKEEKRGSGGSKLIWKWGISKFILSALVAYIDGRLCRRIPNPVARRIVSGFLLSFLENDKK